MTDPALVVCVCLPDGTEVEYPEAATWSSDGGYLTLWDAAEPPEKLAEYGRNKWDNVTRKSPA